MSFYGTEVAIAEDKVPLEIIKIKYEDPIKDYAYWQVVDKWGEGEWFFYKDLIYRESGWKPDAQNPTSTAFGLCQRMMSLHGQEDAERYRADHKYQTEWCIKYIEQRYGNPSTAISFHTKNNWF